MSWNDKMPFSVGLNDLRRRARQEAPRGDRPATLPRAAIQMAHSVFQPRTFGEDLSETEGHVQELVRAIRSSAKNGKWRRLDPIVVTAVGENFFCVDGHHRLLAYERAGVSGEVPVEYFEGSLEDAIREAVKLNSKDRLAMTNEDKLEAAWRLTVLGAASRSETVEASGVADGTVGNMRRALGDLKARGEKPLRLTWREAKRIIKGDPPEFTDEAREAQTREWARRFAKAFGKKAAGQPDVFADALQLYSQRLPRRLVEHWAEMAAEVVLEMRDADEVGKSPLSIRHHRQDAEPEAF